jgi:hypothetical protein
MNHDEAGVICELLAMEEPIEHLTRCQMRENAFHEAGHAVVGLCLGLGPLGSGIKLWSRAVSNPATHGKKFGQVRMCLWTKGNQVVPEEIEHSIVSVLAGELAQHRLTATFESFNWTAHPSQYRADLTLDRWQDDERLIRDLLRELPLKAQQTAASALASLTDRAQRLLDDNWPGVEAVARAVLKTKHYSLSGKQVAALVNDVMHSKYRHVNRCHHVKS